MYLDNNPDYQTVWQLAHNWVNADPAQTDTNAISPELRNAIYRLMLAMRNQEITLRTRQRVVFFDESFISLIADFWHFLKFYCCLKKNKFNKTYLNSLYVKRAEVIDLCIKAYIDPPACWTLGKLLSDSASIEAVDTDDDGTGWYDRLTDRRKRKAGCLELARKLWEENPDQTYDEIRSHHIMKRYGNPAARAPFIKVGAPAVRYRLSDLLAYIESCACQSTSQY